jgi:branched-chain amino acid transport system permease protein
MMLPWLQLFLQGSASGALYGLVAVGTQLISGSTGRAHLGVGHVTVIAALAAAALARGGALALLPSMLGVTACVGFFSHLAHPPVLWKRVMEEGGERVFVLITLGGALTLEAMAQWVWPLPATGWQGSRGLFSLGPISATGSQALAVSASLAASIGLWMLVYRSRQGKALRAWDGGCSELRLVGVDPHGLARWVTWIGLCTAGLGGVLAGATQVVSVHDGLGWTIKALCLAVVSGGLNPIRTMALGWAVGVGENLVSFWAGPQWHQALAPAMLPVVFCYRRIRDS